MRVIKEFITDPKLSSTYIIYVDNNILNTAISP